MIDIYIQCTGIPEIWADAYQLKNEDRSGLFVKGYQLHDDKFIPI